MTPCPPPPLTLEELIALRNRLLTIMTSGVIEVEQPALGRTQYRSLAEVSEALRYVDTLIAAVCPPSVDAALARRRPIYPVVTEY